RWGTGRAFSPARGISDALDAYLADVVHRPRRVSLAAGGSGSDALRPARASPQPLSVRGERAEGERVLACEKRRVPRRRGPILDADQLLRRLPRQLRVPDGQAPGGGTPEPAGRRDPAVPGEAPAEEPARLFVRRRGRREAFQPVMALQGEQDRAFR